jgi:hypothetical protein
VTIGEIDMDHYAVKRLALILAVEAELDAMRLENFNRQQNQYAEAYGAEELYAKAEELRALAHAHNDQLDSI